MHSQTWISDRLDWLITTLGLWISSHLILSLVEGNSGWLISLIDEVVLILRRQALSQGEDGFLGGRLLVVCLVDDLRLVLGFGTVVWRLHLGLPFLDLLVHGGVVAS